MLLTIHKSQLIITQIPRKRMDVTKRVSHIFPIEGGERKGEKQAISSTNRPNRSRQIDDNIVQVVTNSRLPIRPPLYPGEKSRRQNLGSNSRWFRHAYVNWRGEGIKATSRGGAISRTNGLIRAGNEPNAVQS